MTKLKHTKYEKWECGKLINLFMDKPTTAIHNLNTVLPENY